MKKNLFAADSTKQSTKQEQLMCVLVLLSSHVICQLEREKVERGNGF